MAAVSKATRHLYPAPVGLYLRTHLPLTDKWLFLSNYQWCVRIKSALTVYSLHPGWSLSQMWQSTSQGFRSHYPLAPHGGRHRADCLCIGFGLLFLWWDVRRVWLQGKKTQKDNPHDGPIHIFHLLSPRGGISISKVKFCFKILKKIWRAPPSKTPLIPSEIKCFVPAFVSVCYLVCDNLVFVWQHYICFELQLPKWYYDSEICFSILGSNRTVVCNLLYRWRGFVDELKLYWSSWVFPAIPRGDEVTTGV